MGAIRMYANAVIETYAWMLKASPWSKKTTSWGETVKLRLWNELAETYIDCALSMSTFCDVIFYDFIFIFIIISIHHAFFSKISEISYAHVRQTHWWLLSSILTLLIYTELISGHIIYIYYRLWLSGNSVAHVYEITVLRRVTVRGFTVLISNQPLTPTQPGHQSVVKYNKNLR